MRGLGLAGLGSCGLTGDSFFGTKGASPFRDRRAGAGTFQERKTAFAPVPRVDASAALASVVLMVTQSFPLPFARRVFVVRMLAVMAGRGGLLARATRGVIAGGLLLASSLFAAAPVITSPGSASGNLGVPFLYQVTATNNPTRFDYAIFVPSLGGGFFTGVISGTPSSEGTFVGTISATNADGTSSAPLTITIGPPFAAQPVITSMPYALAVPGRPFSYQITATNNPTSFDSGTFGNGLSLNPATGVLSGMPTKDTGWVSTTIRASNAVGMGYGNLLVAFAPETTVLPVITGPATATATVGESLTLWLSWTGEPVLFDASGLPPGLEMAYNLGAISGIPTVEGVYTVNLSALNAAGTEHATLTLTVNPVPAAPVITSPLTATAFVGQPFSYQITASGSPTSFNAEGNMPGLSVSFLTGILSGTFSTPGSYDLDLRATNASGTDHRTLTLLVTTPDSYTAWVLGYGLGGDAANMASDPDVDGLVNLLEYALGTNPLQPSAVQSPAAEMEAGALALHHRRNKTAEITWAYEVSSDLLLWSQAVPVTGVVDADVDGDGKVEMVRALLPLAVGDTRKFLRLTLTARRVGRPSAVRRARAELPVMQPTAPAFLDASAVRPAAPAGW